MRCYSLNMFCLRVFVLFLTMLASVGVCADTWTDPDTGLTWNYQIDNGSAIIGGPECDFVVMPTPDGGLVIPDNLNGLPVTGIYDGAFADFCSLVDICIPDGVTYIGEGAFRNCYALTNVTIGAGVESIGKGAFSNCIGLTSATISASFKNVGNSAFVFLVNGRATTEVTALNSTSNLKDGQSNALTSPQGVTPPARVKGIDRSAFSGCCNLENVSISQYVLDRRLRNVFPDSYASISNVAIIDGATRVRANAFAGSDRLRSVEIPSSVATVDKDGNIKGVAAGTATITVSADTYKDAAVEVTVESNKTLLKDKQGRQVYVRNDDGSYREATYDDYYGKKALYLQVENTVGARYGWWTINGNTYYYDKNGNYVTGEQVIQGAKYKFGSDGVLSSSSGVMGIDVSKWNGSIDWSQVRNSGVKFVIIRCGYRGSSTGALIEDPKFRSNIKGAKAAGLSVGAYFYTQAVNEVEAVEEASMAIGLCSGYGLNLPIFLDVEHSGGRGDGIDAGTRTAVCKAFCNTVRNSGYGAGIYANKVWLTSYMHASQLTGYKIWLAQYAATPTYTATRYDYWQYTSKGSVAGISGNVDMNIKY